MKTLSFRFLFSLLSTLLIAFIFQNPKPVLAEEIDDFVITVKTDNPGLSLNTQFNIPVIYNQNVPFNYNVDCDDDGVFEVEGTWYSTLCDYDTPGTYTIRIQDNNGDGTGFPRISLEFIATTRNYYRLTNGGLESGSPWKVLFLAAATSPFKLRMFQIFQWLLV